MAKAEPVKATKRIAKWKEAEYPTVYANMIGIGMTPFDINIILGEVLESDETCLTGVPKIKILLAPEQAVNLMKLLSIAVDAYVKSNGTMRTSGAVDVAELSGQFEALTKKVN
jgi:hypothetical protein